MAVTFRALCSSSRLAGYRGVQMVASRDLSPESTRYHQQYLYKNPGGYCGIGGTSVKLGDPSDWLGDRGARPR